MDLTERYYLLLILFLSLHSICLSQNIMNGPVKAGKITAEEGYAGGSSIILNFYQRNISRVKGADNCPMLPSCSQYAKIAFKKYPSALAFIMTAERLLRCGNDLFLYETVILNNHIKYYDPVPWNEKSVK